MCLNTAYKCARSSIRTTKFPRRPPVLYRFSWAEATDPRPRRTYHRTRAHAAHRWSRKGRRSRCLRICGSLAPRQERSDCYTPWRAKWSEAASLPAHRSRLPYSAPCALLERLGSQPVVLSNRHLSSFWIYSKNIIHCLICFVNTFFEKIQKIFSLYFWVRCGTIALCEQPIRLRFRSETFYLIYKRVLNRV